MSVGASIYKKLAAKFLQKQQYRMHKRVSQQEDELSTTDDELDELFEKPRTNVKRARSPSLSPSLRSSPSPSSTSPSPASGSSLSPASPGSSLSPATPSPSPHISPSLSDDPEPLDLLGLLDDTSSDDDETLGEPRATLEARAAARGAARSLAAQARHEAWARHSYTIDSTPAVSRWTARRLAAAGLHIKLVLLRRGNVWIEHVALPDPDGPHANLPITFNDTHEMWQLHMDEFDMYEY